MTDNPSYRGGQGQGQQPGDDYYDYGRQGEEPRAPYPPPRRGRLPASAQPARPRPAATPSTGWLPRARRLPRAGGYPPPTYDQRPPSGYGPPPGAGYPDQGYRQPPPPPATARPPATASPRRATTTTGVSPARAR